MGFLTELPPELHCIILEKISSPQDLYNYIRVSHLIYAHFTRTPDRFLSSMLRNSIDTVAQPWAIALSSVPSFLVKPNGHDLSDLVATDLMTDFLKDHFASGQPARTFPTDRASLMTLTREHTRLSGSIQHFVSTALCETSIWASASDFLELQPAANLKEVFKNDRKPGALPYWATLNHEHRQECRSAESRAISTLSSTENARLQRAFYAYEFYCRAVPPKNVNLEESLLSTDEQYEYILAHIPSFQIEEILSVHEYYISIAGKLFDQVENELVDEVLSLPDILHRPRCLFPLATSLSHQKPKGFVGLASSYDLETFCSSYIDEQDHQDEVVFLSAKGAAHIEKILRSSKADRLWLLRQNFGVLREFLSETAWEHIHEVRPGSYYPDEPAAWAPEENSNFPNFGWYACSLAQEPPLMRDCKHSSYRGLGHVFWDVQRMFEEPLRSSLINTEDRLHKYISSRDPPDWMVCWPRRRKRASELLRDFMIKSEDMYTISSKYCSSARTRAGSRLNIF